MSKSAGVRVGIGGWTYAPWRGTFFPEDLPQKEELLWASHQFKSIEINGTFYRAQTPATFQKWHDSVPEDFVFAVKGPRYATHRQDLSEAASSVQKFLNSGVVRLGSKLGPLNWQFAPNKAFDPGDFEAFLICLPAKHEGVPLRHAVEVRHESFDNPAFFDLLRDHDVALVISDKPDVPHFQSLTAQDFFYVRLQAAQERYKFGYAPAAIRRWAEQIKRFAATREGFVYVINGYKPLAPGAALQLKKYL